MVWYNQGGGGGTGETAAQVQARIDAAAQMHTVLEPTNTRVGGTPRAADWPHNAPSEGDVLVYQYPDGSSDTFAYETGSWNPPLFIEATDDLSGKVYNLTPFPPFTRSPQQSDFAAALAADVAGPALYKAGDTLRVETPDDGHYFFTRILEDAASPGTLTLSPMDIVIPSGLEFTELPTNRATYHEGYRIDFNGIVYAMVSGAWFRLTAGISTAAAAGGDGDVTTVAMTQAISDAIAAEDILSKAEMKAVLDDIPMQKLSEGFMTTTEVNTYLAQRTAQGI